MEVRLSSIEQEELVLKNRRLVYYLVNRLDVAPSDYDDIVSIGTIGLIKAAATFDQSKNIKFATYAAQCINNEIFMHFRKKKAYINDISLDNPIYNDGEASETTLGDMIPNSNEDFTERIAETEDFIKCISIILNLLEQRDRVVMLYTIAGTSQKAIAKMLNISQSYVSRLEKKVYEKVRSHFTKSKQFKEVFSMKIAGDSYNISFASKDVKQFNKIFATMLQNLTLSEDIPNFRVDCTKERIIIRVPAQPESFAFIAKIIQEIDTFSIIFASDKSILSASNDNLKDMEMEDARVPEEADINSKESSNEDDISQCDTKERAEGCVSQSKKIREYILTLDSFSVKQVKSLFSDVSTAVINSVIMSAKSKGLITPTARGEYAVNKT